MNIFSDLHHSGLYYSFHLLFEKRLEHFLFRPVGLEWFERGFWDIAKPYNDDKNTVRQYLSLQSGFKPVDASPPLNQTSRHVVSSVCYYLKDNYHDVEHKGLTFAQFIDMDIDVIIASIPAHWRTYKRLRDQFKPKAKLICHMGNMFNEINEYVREEKGRVNLLASTIPFTTEANALFYHQEQPVRPYNAPEKTLRISSYVHLLPKKEQFLDYASAATHFNWQAFGASSPDGWMPTLSDLYDSMQQDMFVYHVKPYGDGYGWNWHSAFMLGRPVLTNFSDYRDKLGGKLFEDGVTGLDFEAHTTEENCQLLTKWTNTDHFHHLAQQARKRWEEVVNYEDDAARIKEYLARLL